MNEKDYPINNQPVNLLKEDMDALFEKQDIERLKKQSYFLTRKNFIYLQDLCALIKCYRMQK